MHAFTPHSHADHISYIPEISEDHECEGVLNAITRAISFNLGADHLEHYNHVNQLNLVPSVAGLTVLANDINFQDDDGFALKPDVSNLITTCSGFFATCISRGPPCLI